MSIGKSKNLSASAKAASTCSSGIGWSTSVLPSRTEKGLSVRAEKRFSSPVLEHSQEPNVGRGVNQLLLDLFATGVKVAQGDLRDDGRRRRSGSVDGGHLSFLAVGLATKGGANLRSMMERREREKSGLCKVVIDRLRPRLIASGFVEPGLDRNSADLELAHSAERGRDMLPPAFPVPRRTAAHPCEMGIAQ